MATRRQLRSAPSPESRFGFADVAQWVKLADTSFPMTGGGDRLDALPGRNFSEFSEVYRTNGIVAACMNARLRIFSEVTFRFAEVNNGKVGNLFGSPDLAVLEHPWPNGTTGELAARMIQDTDLAGNFFAVRVGDRLYRRDPSKVSIVLTGDPTTDEFVDVAGYVYRPGGDRGPEFTYLPHEMCHWSPLPDPEATYRGMSWLTPVLREIRSDNAATDHKAKFFANGGTPTMVVKFPPEVMNEEQLDEFRAKMDAAYGGARNAYKTLYLAPGADVSVVGADMQQLDFSNTQGRDETRIASAAGVPAVIVGLKESLSGSSLNAGNYSAARRNLADGTMRPLYRSAAAALETLVPVPKRAKDAAKLWYDDSAVAFFREDRGDAAEIQRVRAATIRNLVDAGYLPASVVAAVDAEDMTLLEHSGLFSVQLQKPGTGPTTPTGAKP